MPITKSWLSFSGRADTGRERGLPLLHVEMGGGLEDGKGRLAGSSLLGR